MDYAEKRKDAFNKIFNIIKNQGQTRIPSLAMFMAESYGFSKTVLMKMLKTMEEAEYISIKKDVVTYLARGDA